MREKVKLVVMLVVFIVMFVFASWIDTHYTRHDCEVIGYTEDVVTVEDSCGYQWQFIGEGYEVGDTVDLKMYTNHTDNYIYDDEIIEVK